MPISSPTTIPGCMLWLDANDTSTMFEDFAGTIPAISNNDPITLWRDKSGNNNHFTVPPYPITRSGTTVSQGSFSPFSFALSSSGTPYTSASGGSCYFDGSSFISTVLSSESSFGTGDFTIEAWVHTLGTTITNNTIYSDISSCTFAYGPTGRLSFFTGASANAVYATTPAVSGRWVHVAAVRSSGTLSLYQDGIVVSTTPGYTHNITNGATSFIGQAYNATNRFTGYISDFRILKGVARTITAPPTEPLKPVPNTSILLNFTNGSIIDSTGRNNVIQVGDARIVNNAFKYGVGSLAFDGTGDYLTILTSSVNRPFADLINWYSTDFTLEYWIYVNSFSQATLNSISASPVIGNVIPTNGSNSSWWSFGPIANQQVRFNYWTGAVQQTITTTDVLSVGTWQHLALVNSLSTVTIYIDGVPKASNSIIGTPVISNAQQLAIGSCNGVGFNGFLEDIRITKGVARTITVPTTSYPNNSTDDPNFSKTTLLLQADNFIPYPLVLRDAVLDNSNSLRLLSATCPSLLLSAQNLKPAVRFITSEWMYGNVTNFRYLTGGATIMCAVRPLSASRPDTHSGYFWSFGNIQAAGSPGIPGFRSLALISGNANTNNETITLITESPVLYPTGRMSSTTYTRAVSTSEILTTQFSVTGTTLFQNTLPIALNNNTQSPNTVSTAPSSYLNWTVDDTMYLNAIRANTVIDAVAPTMDWLEFIVYNRSLSNQERGQVEFYLSQKWNLPTYALANRSGNWTDSSMWMNLETPMSSHDVYANSFTVNIDTNINVRSLNTYSGGGFIVDRSRTLNITGDGIIAGTTPCVVCTIQDGSTVYLNSRITGGTSTDAFGFNNSSLGTIRWTSPGGIRGGTGTRAHGLMNNSYGTLYTVGPLSGGGTATTYGVYNNNIGYINHVGDIFGGVNGAGLAQNPGFVGIVYVTGRIKSSPNANGLVYQVRTSASNLRLCSSFETDIITGRVPALAPQFLLLPKPYASYTRTFSPSSASKLLSYSAVDDYSIYLHPEAKDVEYGVTYGAYDLSGIPVQLIGSMFVPDRTAVEYGVPVGTTTGAGLIGVVSLQKAWEIPITNLKIKNSVGQRASKIAQISELGDLLARVNV